MLFLYLAAVNAKDSLLQPLRRLRDDLSGVTAIEYGLIAGAIAVVIIGGVVLLGGDISGLFTTIAGSISSSGVTAPTTGTTTP